VTAFLTRRDTLVLGAGTAVALSVPRVFAQEEPERHGMSAFGDLKYPADFKYFDYVNPDAPKGGRFSQVGPNRAYNQNFLTFNSLNMFILKGDGAQGMELTFAALMAGAADEPDGLYGFAARAVRISPDGLTYRFVLRPEAKFHDGTRITAQDVAFSLTLLKQKGHPIIQQLTRDFVGAEAEGDDAVVARFAPKRGRDVPLFVATLPIFSKAYYSVKNFDESTLDTPLGSGPYKVGRLEAGRFIEYERVKNWWGENLPVRRGLNNFDIVRYEFYRDREAAFQAFTAKNYTFREEFTARVWATRYDFPAMRDGRVKREMLPDDTPSGAQGWFLNTRREKFKNPKLREALIYAFDFEWTNKNVMYGAYQRTHSVFQNSDLMAVGKPSPEEVALLEPFRGKVPDEVFGEPYVPPVSDGSGSDRNLLRRADALLREAGCKREGTVLKLPDGKPFEIEFLDYQASLQPHTQPFQANLKRLGIEARSRIVDAAQYRRRMEEFDFDMASMALGGAMTPGDALRIVFSSEAAATPGSRNIAGIADPAVDALIGEITQADSRAKLNVAARALDRLLRAGRYMIPMWFRSEEYVAYWDMFSRPATRPKYASGAPGTWWYDPEKAKAIGKA